MATMSKTTEGTGARRGSRVALATVLLLACQKEPVPSPDAPTSVVETPTAMPSASARTSVEPTASAADGAPTARAAGAPDDKCAPRPPTPDPGPTPPPKEPLVGLGDEVRKVTDECTRHAQCVAQPRGRCVAIPTREGSIRGQSFVVPAHNECVYDACARDADCAADWLCNCAPADRNTCYPGDCRDDRSCKAPSTCGPGSFCASAGDECRKTDDCARGSFCAYDHPKRHYACKTPEVPRPG